VTQANPDTPTQPAGIRIRTGQREGFVLYPLGLETTFGRMKSVTVFLPDLKASRNHCMIIWDRNRWILLDLSSNGTYLNGARIQRTTDVPLKNEDVIRVGAAEIEFRLARAVQPQASGAPPTQTPQPAAARPPTQTPQPAAARPPAPATPAPAAPPAPASPTPVPAAQSNTSTAAWPVMGDPGPAPLPDSGVEFEFDFEVSDQAGDLDKVFEDFDEYSSTATQEMEIYDPKDLGLGEDGRSGS
jgi:predicted component of type VI protein secretion system